jgi:hypothetical protein
MGPDHPGEAYRLASDSANAGVASLCLLVPEKSDPERDAVAEAWTRAGGEVIPVGRFWEPPEIDRARVRVYGNDTFCLVLAEKLGLELVTPDDRLLESLSRDLLSRDVRIEKLSELTFASPIFVKPVVPKQFAAGVHASRDSIAALTRGLASDVEVYVSNVVRFEAEARAFVLDGRVRTCAIYEGAGDAAEAAGLADRAAREKGIPRTCVIDVGRLAAGKWAVVEFNATWGAGLNGCAADDVVACIAAASSARGERP